MSTDAMVLLQRAAARFRLDHIDESLDYNEQCQAIDAIADISDRKISLDVPSSVPPEAVKSCMKADLRVGFASVIVAKYTREECQDDYLGHIELHEVLFQLMERARSMWAALRYPVVL